MRFRNEQYREPETGNRRRRVERSDEPVANIRPCLEQAEGIVWAPIAAVGEDAPRGEPVRERENRGPEATVCNDARRDEPALQGRAQAPLRKRQIHVADIDDVSTPEEHSEGVERGSSGCIERREGIEKAEEGEQSPKTARRLAAPDVGSDGDRQCDVKAPDERSARGLDEDRAPGDRPCRQPDCSGSGKRGDS